MASQRALIRLQSRKVVIKLDLVALRNLIQVSLALILLYVGWRFYLFFQHFETLGTTQYVERPAAVEAFLPLSALVATKNLVANGVFDTIHPAGLTLFLAILTISLLFKKAVCSWLCPIGTLSEALARLGKNLFGRNFRLPKYVDWPLMSIKYLILGFFIKSIIIDMPPLLIAAFVQSPYNKIADVKMLQFFIGVSSEGIVVIGALMLLSVLVSNFWCRYLCPYGALLGLLSYLSVFHVTRNPARCTDCKLCTKACLNRIDVATANDVTSPECSSCLNCISACPRAGALTLKAFGRWDVSPWLYPALVVGVLSLAIVAAKFTGHWETSITYEEYAKLIPIAETFSH